LWGAEDLKVPLSMLGLNASPTGVRKIFEPDRKRKGEVISGSEKQMAKELIEKLKEVNVI
jgi:electron transfer flavoprotein beta subunit